MLKMQAFVTTQLFGFADWLCKSQVLVRVTLLYIVKASVSTVKIGLQAKINCFCELFDSWQIYFDRAGYLLLDIFSGSP